MQELEKMTDAQINDKLQAMLVSGGIFSNTSYYIMMMWCDTLPMIEQLEAYLTLSFKEKDICGILSIYVQWPVAWEVFMIKKCFFLKISKVCLSTRFLDWIWCIGGKFLTYKDLVLL